MNYIYIYIYIYNLYELYIYIYIYIYIASYALDVCTYNLYDCAFWGTVVIKLLLIILCIHIFLGSNIILINIIQNLRQQLQTTH